MNKYQHTNLKITTLSPMHIGNGEQLSPVGEFYTTLEKVYFLDNKRLIQAVKDIGKMEEYIEKILEDGIGLDFYKVLEDWNIDVKKYSDRTVSLNQVGVFSSHNNILHQCIKTNQQAYIPGSSLKGLFRTAMIMDFFTNNKYVLKQVETDIREKSYHGKKELSKMWNRIEKQYFPDFVFHALRLTDSDSIADKKLVIEQTSRVPFYESDGEGVDWLVESIQPDQSLNTVLTVFPKFEKKRIEAYFNHKKNKDLKQDDFHIDDWEYLKKREVSKLIAIVNNYSLVLIDFEMNLLHKTEQNKALSRKLIGKLQEYKELIQQSDNKYAIARIGKGKTLFFQSILPILSENIKEVIINYYREENHFDFPRTRVLTMKDKEMSGWIKLDFDRIQSAIEDIAEETKDVEKIAILEKKYTDNKVNTLDKGQNLHALFVETKRVEIMINGQVNGYPLINKFKKNFPINSPVKVVINQISKAGIIVQVKLKL